LGVITTSLTAVYKQSKFDDCTSRKSSNLLLNGFFAVGNPVEFIKLYKLHRYPEEKLK